MYCADKTTSQKNKFEYRVTGMENVEKYLHPCNIHLKITTVSLMLFLLSPGMVVGHIYYFLEDVFPTQRGGFKLIKTPGIL